MFLVKPDKSCCTSCSILPFDIHPWFSHAQIFNFINEALEKGDSVLVHSLDGTGRCIACVAAYLMCRYRWGVEKALEFLCSKRPDAAPNTGFVQQVSSPRATLRLRLDPSAPEFGFIFRIFLPKILIRQTFPDSLISRGRIACHRRTPLM